MLRLSHQDSHSNIFVEQSNIDKQIHSCNTKGRAEIKLLTTTCYVGAKLQKHIPTEITNELCFKRKQQEYLVDNVVYLLPFTGRIHSTSCWAFII